MYKLFWRARAYWIIFAENTFNSNVEQNQK